MNDVMIAGWLFAITIAGLAGWVGFNQPSWSRTYTTIGRYRLALFVHVAVYLVVLLALYAVARRVAVAAGYPQLRGELLFAALVATLVVRLTPMVFYRLRDSLIAWAGVPEQAQRFARHLAASPLHPDERIRAQAEALLVHRGIGPEQDWLAVARPLRKNLLEATELYLQLRSWKDAAAFLGFVREARHELQELYQRFDRLSFRAARTLSSIEKLAEMNRLFLEREPAGTRAADGEEAEFDKHVRALVDDLVADACEGINFFHRDACMLAARGVMTTQPLRSGRDRAVSRLGFEVKPREGPSVYGMLVYAACLLYAGLWLFFLLLPPDRVEQAMKTGQLIAVITLNVLGSIAIAVVPKFHWGFANSGLRQKTPVAFVIGAGVASMLFATGVNLAAGALVYGGSGGPMQRVTEALPYLPSSFITAAVIAWLIQDHRWSGRAAPSTRRMLDAAVLGLAWLVSSLLSRLIAGGSPETLLEPRAGLVALGAFVFGAVMGCVIPSPVRGRTVNDGGPAIGPASLSEFGSAAAPAFGWTAAASR